VAVPLHRLHLTAAFVSLLAFVLVEVSQGRPMVKLGLFRRGTFVGAVPATIGHGASAQADDLLSAPISGGCLQG
jgi:hypothetical protein